MPEVVTIPNTACWGMLLVFEIIAMAAVTATTNPLVVCHCLSKISDTATAERDRNASWDEVLGAVEV